MVEVRKYRVSSVLILIFLSRKTKQKEVFVVQTKKRPVPLEHYLFTGNSNKTSNELFCVLDQKGRFKVEGYRQACQAKKARASKSDESYGPKGTRQGNPKQVSYFYS